jgi:hypothetical protein
MSIERTVGVEREAVLDVARLAWAVMDDGTTPEALRAQADKVLQWAHVETCWGVPGGRTVRCIPAGFRIMYYYVEKLGEILAELPEDAVQMADLHTYGDLVRFLGNELGQDVALPIRIKMLRQAAKLADRAGYGTDFRLEAIEAFEEIAAMRDYIDADDETEVAP